MAVMMPREKWTDERLDDLNKKVDEGFADTKAAIAETKAEMRQGFNRLETRIANMEAGNAMKFAEVEARREKNFSDLNERFDRLQHTLMGGTAVIAAAIIGSGAF